MKTNARQGVTGCVSTSYAQSNLHIASGMAPSRSRNLPYYSIFVHQETKGQRNTVVLVL